MLIRKYYNTYKNEDDNVLENIDEIKKILDELNEEPSEDETLIDKIIKIIKEKKKNKEIDPFYTISAKKIKRLLIKLMNKNTSDESIPDDDTTEAKYMTNKIKKECNKGGITKPWSTNSNLLYIAVVIDRTSDVGLEIEHRISATGHTAYSKYGSGKLHCPHISILQIFIKEGTNFDDWIKSNLKSISDKIVELYKSMFERQIHSQYDHYENLGGWCVRSYDDDKSPNNLLSTVKNTQTDFRKKINNYLLLTYLGFASNQYHKYIQEQSNIDPFSPLSSTQKFIHFNIKPSTESIMAEGSYFTDDWAPHVSLLKTNDTNYHDEFKSKASGSRNMSWINLWGSAKNIVIGGAPRKGTISYIFVSYAGVNNWLPI
jgi:hypothetical protein